MGTAYTPGLKVSPRTLVKKYRRLPLRGQVLASQGDIVQPDTVVARTEIPGVMQTVRAAETLGVDLHDLHKALRVKIGDMVTKNQLLAETRSFFGLMRNEVKSPIPGVVELISDQTGHIGIRLTATPIEVTGYITGRVAEVVPEEGVIVETEAAMIQGIFGVGGEKTGAIHMLVSSPDQPITEDMLDESMAGKVVVGGSNVSGAALRKANRLNIAGVVVGAIIDRDLIDFLGYDIGVAITGQEDISTTLVITEGFGSIRMADRTFSLLKSLEGKQASVNGATQIRAGVIRPEVIVPLGEDLEGDEVVDAVQALEIGAHIRAIREPYFGMLGNVTGLPPEPMVVPSGSTVRVLEAELSDGRKVTIPRANVEIIAE